MQDEFEEAFHMEGEASGELLVVPIGLHCDSDADTVVDVCFGHGEKEEKLRSGTARVWIQTKTQRPPWMIHFWI